MHGVGLAPHTAGLLISLKTWMAMISASFATPDDVGPSPAAIPATWVPCLQLSPAIKHGTPAPEPMSTSNPLGQRVVAKSGAQLVPKHASDTTLPERKECVFSTPESNIAMVWPAPVYPKLWTLSALINGMLADRRGCANLSPCIDFTKGELIRCNNEFWSIDIELKGVYWNLWCNDILYNDKDSNNSFWILEILFCCINIAEFDFNNPSGLNSVSNWTITLTVPCSSIFSNRFFISELGRSFLISSSMLVSFKIFLMSDKFSSLPSNSFNVWLKVSLEFFVSISILFGIPTWSTVSRPSKIATCVVYPLDKFSESLFKCNCLIFNSERACL